MCPYLLRVGEISRWHRVDGAEIWHWYGGDALELSIGQDAGLQRVVLGPGARYRRKAGKAPGLWVPIR